ncbi:ubiquinol-cytochrome c reductase iron-sulfur subunit [Deinococcus psychrotolerans]|uniref:Ubiquinol-cytochrome c reductase iron-sulfur subunit n=1 Tax=Deinococcus psychrotolerans TaxID=2489213 RepID=A0A3G8YNH5_9DEIO|nr:ubiquinol-cytochrome c reductase iron-sulfur subunit [Deinococcus psychrotolerans]AZI43141.1 ubiquinol-cytochrome c reductase iron-sulfur subunit [Deinococcus psychrotolerans]
MPTRRQLLEKWWLLPVGATVGVFGYMGYYASRITFGKEKPSAPDFVTGTAVRVAALTALSGEWAQQAFSYDKRPCILLRLPAATLGSLEVDGQHYAAFSRICTHLGCTVNLVKDPEVLAFSFSYRPPDNMPRLGCPCHFSVFDPLRSGEAVFGKARAPLPRVRLERRGAALWATGIEAAPPLGT